VSLGKTFAALLCGALLLLPGCGDDNKGRPIPAEQADSLVKNIQAADQYSADGRCGRAQTKVRDAKFVLSNVPQSVDADVRKGISDGLDHLTSLIEDECERPQNTQTDTTPTETQTTVTETQTTPTETTPTETQPTQTETTLTGTTPTETTPTTPTTTGNGGTGGTPPGQANGADGAVEGQG
jgi:hypothetical protein